MNSGVDAEMQCFVRLGQPLHSLPKEQAGRAHPEAFREDRDAREVRGRVPGWDMLLANTHTQRMLPSHPLSQLHPAQPPRGPTRVHLS